MPLPPFSTFFAQNRDLVYSYLVLRLGRRDAEDVFQETFLAALEAYPRLQHDSHLRAWVMKIAENKVIDAARKRGRETVGPVDGEGVAAEPDYRDQDLWSDVRRLPDKQQSAIAFRYLGDLSYREVGAAMGTSADAARRNVHEGLKKLREAAERG